jgi:hypothetical protein
MLRCRVIDWRWNRVAHKVVLSWGRRVSTHLVAHHRVGVVSVVRVVWLLYALTHRVLVGDLGETHWVCHVVVDFCLGRGQLRLFFFWGWRRVVRVTSRGLYSFFNALEDSSSLVLAELISVCPISVKRSETGQDLDEMACSVEIHSVLFGHLWTGPLVLVHSGKHREDEVLDMRVHIIV